MDIICQILLDLELDYFNLTNKSILDSAEWDANLLQHPPLLRGSLRKFGTDATSTTFHPSS